MPSSGPVKCTGTKLSDTTAIGCAWYYGTGNAAPAYAPPSAFSPPRSCEEGFSQKFSYECAEACQCDVFFHCKMCCKKDGNTCIAQLPKGWIVDAASPPTCQTCPPGFSMDPGDVGGCWSSLFRNGLDRRCVKLDGDLCYSRFPAACQASAPPAVMFAAASPPAETKLSMGTAVLDQGQCGSCFAFAASGVASDRFGGGLTVSPQRHLQCVKKSSACGGGFPLEVLTDWINSPALTCSGVAGTTASPCTTGCDPYTLGSGSTCAGGYSSDANVVPQQCWASGSCKAGGSCEQCVAFLNGACATQAPITGTSRDQPCGTTAPTCKAGAAAAGDQVTLGSKGHKPQKFSNGGTFPVTSEVQAQVASTPPHLLAHVIRANMDRYGSMSFSYEMTDKFQAMDFATKGVFTRDMTVGAKATGGHAVRCSGYDVTAPVPYYLCANSWGPSWGDAGYFRIEMGADVSRFESWGVDGTVLANGPTPLAANAPVAPPVAPVAPPVAPPVEAPVAAPPVAAPVEAPVASPPVAAPAETPVAEPVATRRQTPEASTPEASAPHSAPEAADAAVPHSAPEAADAAVPPSAPEAAGAAPTAPHAVPEAVVPETAAPHSAPEAAAAPHSAPEAAAAPQDSVAAPPEMFAAPPESESEMPDPTEEDGSARQDASASGDDESNFDQGLADDSAGDDGDGAAEDADGSPKPTAKSPGDMKFFAPTDPLANGSAMSVCHAQGIEPDVCVDACKVFARVQTTGQGLEMYVDVACNPTESDINATDFENFQDARRRRRQQLAPSAAVELEMDEYTEYIAARHAAYAQRVSAIAQRAGGRQAARQAASVAGKTLSTRASLTRKLAANLSQARSAVKSGQTLSSAFSTSGNGGTANASSLFSKVAELPTVTMPNTMANGTASCDQPCECPAVPITSRTNVSVACVCPPASRNQTIPCMPAARRAISPNARGAEFVLRGCPAEVRSCCNAAYNDVCAAGWSMQSCTCPGVANYTCPTRCSAYNFAQSDCTASPCPAACGMGGALSRRSGDSPRCSCSACGTGKVSVFVDVPCAANTTCCSEHYTRVCAAGVRLTSCPCGGATFACPAACTAAPAPFARAVPVAAPTNAAPVAPPKAPSAAPAAASTPKAPTAAPTGTPTAAAPTAGTPTAAPTAGTPTAGTPTAAPTTGTPTAASIPKAPPTTGTTPVAAPTGNAPTTSSTPVAPPVAPTYPAKFRLAFSGVLSATQQTAATTSIIDFLVSSGVIPASKRSRVVVVFVSARQTSTSASVEVPPDALSSGVTPESATSTVRSATTSSSSTLSASLSTSTGVPLAASPFSDLTAPPAEPPKGSNTALYALLVLLIIPVVVVVVVVVICMRRKKSAEQTSPSAAYGDKPAGSY